MDIASPHLPHQFQRRSFPHACRWLSLSASVKAWRLPDSKRKRLSPRSLNTSLVNRCQDLRDIDQVSMRLAEGRYLGRGEVLPTSLAEIALPIAVSVAVLTKSFCLLSRSLGKSHWERPFLFFQWLLNPLFGSFSIASHVQLPHASAAFRETTP